MAGGMVRRGGFKGGGGFIEIDNTASGGKIERYPTMTCAHCGSLEILNELRTRPRGKCYRCARYICDKCDALGECNFFEESLELAIKYPGQGPFLMRAMDGKPLYDTALRDKHRIAGVGFSKELVDNKENTESTTE